MKRTIRTLVSWIGTRDLRAWGKEAGAEGARLLAKAGIKNDGPVDSHSPLKTAAESGKFDCLVLLCDYDPCIAKLGRVFRYQVALRSETEELSRPDNIEGREEFSFRNDIAGSIATAFSMLEVRKQFVASRICPDRCHKLVKGLLAGKPKGLIAREMGISASSFTRLKDKTLAILKETAPVWAKVSLIGGPDKTGRGTTVILGI